MVGFLFSEGPIRLLQGLLSPMLDLPFLIITSTGSQVFLLGLAVILYWTGRKRLGFLLAIVLMGSGVLNAALKAAFGMPRPSVELHRTYASGNGFPSGHAQQSTAFWATLALVLRGRWPVPATAAIFLVALSRVYLGVHYVGDVLGGAAFGAAVSVLFVALHSSRVVEGLSFPRKLALATILPAALAPGVLLGLDVVATWGLLTGISVGYLLEAEWVDLERPSRPLAIVLRLSMGVPTLGGLWLLGWRLDVAAAILAYHIFLGLVATLMLPWIFGMVEAFVLRTPSDRED